MSTGYTRKGSPFPLYGSEVLRPPYIQGLLARRPLHRRLRPLPLHGLLDEGRQLPLRQHIPARARISGVITDGGEAANIVPAHTAATFIVRAEDDVYLEELKGRVINCFTGAATATGARSVGRES